MHIHHFAFFSAFQAKVVVYNSMILCRSCIYDVVVTTPIDEFVTILKGGMHNPSVRRALGR